jgi:hypothetical protein
VAGHNADSPVSQCGVLWLGGKTVEKLFSPRFGTLVPLERTVYAWGGL